MLQVPKNYTEKDLTPLFSKYGVVKDIIVLVRQCTCPELMALRARVYGMSSIIISMSPTHLQKDKVTGSPRGCAFVSYATKAEALLAIRNLDRQVQLTGALCPLEVSCAFLQPVVFNNCPHLKSKSPCFAVGSFR